MEFAFLNGKIFLAFACTNDKLIVGESPQDKTNCRKRHQLWQMAQIVTSDNWNGGYKYDQRL